MNLTVILLCILPFIFQIIWCLNILKNSKLRSLALKQDDESFMQLYNWRIANPGVYIGLSPEGRKLVLKHIETFEVYLKAHDTKDTYDHLVSLESLLHDFPKPPGKSCRPISITALKRAVTFYLA